MPTTDTDISDSRHLHDADSAELFDELASARSRRQRQRLCDEIITRTMPMADRLAAHYRDRGVPMDDLRQVARTALVQAMQRFRGAGENAFVAYAVPSIRGELKRYFRDRGWMVRPPRRIQEARLAVNEAVGRLSIDLGREPTVDELAEETGVDADVVVEARATDHCYRPDSLDRPSGDDGQLSVGDAVGHPDRGMRQAEARAVLEPLLNTLEPRDRKVVILRYFKDLTQREVGERVGLTQMQISRIESRILSQFRDVLKPRRAA